MSPGVKRHMAEKAKVSRSRSRLLLDDGATGHYLRQGKLPLLPLIGRSGGLYLPNAASTGGRPFSPRDATNPGNSERARLYANRNLLTREEEWRECAQIDRFRPMVGTPRSHNQPPAADSGPVVRFDKNGRITDFRRTIHLTVREK